MQIADAAPSLRTRSGPGYQTPPGDPPPFAPSPATIPGTEVRRRLVASLGIWLPYQLMLVDLHEYLAAAASDCCPLLTDLNQHEDSTAAGVIETLGVDATA